MSVYTDAMHPMSAQEIEDVLTSQTLGSLACCKDNVPYIIPMAFAYKSGVLYGQTTEGKKTDILRKNSAVCFQVTQTQSDTWQSVLIEGKYEEFDFDKPFAPDVADAIAKLHIRLKAVQDLVGISAPITTNGKPKPLTIDGKRTILFRIVATNISGRKGGTYES